MYLSYCDTILTTRHISNLHPGIPLALYRICPVEEDNTMSSRNKISDQPRCGLCGKTKNLTKMECCGNWICDDEHKYVMFSYARNSCHRNHLRYTLCGYHSYLSHSQITQGNHPHLYGFGVFHFSLIAAFHTIRFQR